MNIYVGNAGSGLGYEGIFNALSVEVDTFHNYDQMDYYENHISVMTQVITCFVCVSAVVIGYFLYLLVPNLNLLITGVHFFVIL